MTEKVTMIDMTFANRIPKRFASKHDHEYAIKNQSNVIQRDGMGYPLRLCLVSCKFCGLTEQLWIDSDEMDDDVELRWRE